MPILPHIPSGRCFPSFYVTKSSFPFPLFHRSNSGMLSPEPNASCEVDHPRTWTSGGRKPKPMGHLQGTEIPEYIELSRCLWSPRGTRFGPGELGETCHEPRAPTGHFTMLHKHGLNALSHSANAVRPTRPTQNDKVYQICFSCETCMYMSRSQRMGRLQAQRERCPVLVAESGLYPSCRILGWL